MSYYLAGPITGKPDYNEAEFRKVAQNLRAEGHEVISPLELDREEQVPIGSKTHEEYMRRDIPYMLACDAVAVLDGWRDSKGATLEVKVARACGLSVVDAYSLEPVDTSEEMPTVCHGLPVENDPYTWEWVAGFARTFFDRALELARRKNADYANRDPFSNLRRGGLFGLAIRMDDKVARLVNLSRGQQAAVKEEPIDDTLLDLFNYSWLAAAMREQGRYSLAKGTDR